MNSCYIYSAAHIKSPDNLDFDMSQRNVLSDHKKLPLAKSRQQNLVRRSDESHKDETRVIDYKLTSNIVYEQSNTHHHTLVNDNSFTIN